MLRSMVGPREVPATPVPGSRTSTDAGGEPADPSIRTFLIADVRGYTAYTQREGDEAAALLAARFAEVTREVVAGHSGVLLELRGDEALVVFTSARQGIRAALALQEAFVDETLSDSTLVLPVGIGLDAGEAVAVEGGYRGGALNLAARLCGRAGPGEVLASQEVTHLARHLSGVRYESRGRLDLKGMSGQVPVVRVVLDPTDPTRESAFRSAVAPPRPPRMSRRRLLTAGALVLVLLAAAGVYAANQASETSAGLSVGDRVDLVDVGSGRVLHQVRLGKQPSAIASGAGSLWATNAGDGTVSRIDPDSRTVRGSIDVGGKPTGVVVAGGFVWVTDQVGQSVAQINPDVGRLVSKVQVGNRPTGIAAGPSGVWVANSADGTVTQIDPRTGDVVKTVDVGNAPTGIAVTADTVWVTNNADGTVSAVDARTGTLRDSFPVGNGPAGIVSSAGSLWVATTLDGSLARMDPATGAVMTKIQVGNGPTGVVATRRAVWVSNEFGATVVRVDPARGQVDKTVRVGGAPQGLALAGGQLWVTASGAGTVHRGGTLNVVAGSQLNTIDPANILGGVASIAGMVYDHLVSFRRAGGAAGATLVPDLATAVPTAVDGGTTYTFRLRHGIRYSDGRRVRASDVRRGVERTFLLNDTFGALYYAGVRGADACNAALEPTSCDLSAGIETDDASGSVTFHLVAPDPEFLAKLAIPAAGAVPPGTPDHDVGTAAVPGTGPYMVGRFEPERSLELVRNPYFREWSRAARPDGFPDRIVFRVPADDAAEDTGLEAVLRGDADLVLGFGSFRGRARELRTRFPGQLHQETGRFMQYLQLNTRMPPFDEVLARRALNYAVDRARLEELWGGYGGTLQSSCQLLPPGFPGYSRYCPYTRDLAKARRLVRVSGTSGDRVTLLAAEDDRELGRYLAQVLDDLGYRSHLTVVPEDQRYDAAYRLGATTGIVFYGWGADFPASSGYLADTIGCADQHPTTTNTGGFCDPRLEGLIQQALTLQATQPAESARLWQQVDHAGVDLAATLPLGILVEDVVTSERVGNYQHQPAYGVLFDQLWVR